MHPDYHASEIIHSEETGSSSALNHHTHIFAVPRLDHLNMRYVLLDGQRSTIRSAVSFGSARLHA